MKNKILLLLILWLGIAASLYAQQPQTGSPDPQFLQGINSKWTNGVGPGYWPYQKTGTCTGLNLCISPGTVPQCVGTSAVTYAGTSSFSLTNNATNYLYLDLDNSCVPTANTTGFSNRNPAIAKIVTSGGAVTSLLDVRFWGGSQVVLGAVNAQTGASYTIANTDRNKLITLSNAGAIAVTLPTTLGASFTTVVQNIGTGTATLTPSSGTINGAASIALTGGSGSTGQGTWLFYDGTNWEAMIGGGSGGGGGGSAIKECIVTTGDPGAASPALANDNDSPAQCGNDFGADITITAVACWADAGSPTVTPILTGGSSTSILTGALTCGTAGWAAGSVNGTPTIHAFSSNGATCSSTPCTLDSNITTAGGTAKYVVVKYTGTTNGGATTPLNMGTASNHDVLYDNAGSVGGITPSTAGQSITSVGAGSTPAFRGCHLSNGVNAQTVGYTLLAADNGSLVTMNGSSLTATLPNPAPSTTWCASVMNLSSSTNLTISRNGLSINTASSNLTLLPFSSVTIWTDGSNYFATLPFGTGFTTSASGVTATTTAPPASSHLLGSNSSSQFVAATGHDIAVPLTCADSSGSGSAQTCTTSPTFTPAANDCVTYTTTTTNSGTSLTLNVNSLGAKSVAVPGASGWTTTLTASTIPANKPMPACYDGTNWNLISDGVSASGGGGCSSGTGNPAACLLEEHTVSGATDVQFTTCITSSYNVYDFTLQDVQFGTNNVDLYVRVSSNGGTSYISTSSYSYAIPRWDTGGGSGNSSSTSDTQIKLEGFALLSNTATPAYVGSFRLYSPLSTTMNKLIIGNGFAPTVGFNPNEFRYAASYNSTSTAVNAIQILASSGTITGTFRCYGLNK